MFEYWFLDLKDEAGTFDHTGTTHDFLEVVSQVSQMFGEEFTGQFIEKLLAAQKDQLPFLRVIEWKFEYTSPEGSVKLHKLR